MSWPPRAGSKPVQIVKMTMVHNTHGIMSMPSSWNKGSNICSNGTLRDCRVHCLDVVFVLRQVPIQQIDQSHGLQSMRSFLSFFRAPFPNLLFRIQMCPRLSHHLSPAQLCLTLFALQTHAAQATSRIAVLMLLRLQSRPIMQIPRSILCATALERLIEAHLCSLCPVWSQDIIGVVVAHFHACSSV